MTDEEKEELQDFLGGNWYQRDETDEEIIQEIVAEEDPEYLGERLNLIERFLEMPEDELNKERFIGNAVERYVDEAEETYSEWLARMLTLLKAQRAGRRD